jgi:hypothetical protein
VVTITTITKTVSWGSISITTITTISSKSQTMAIRYGGSGIGGDLGNGGGGSIGEPMSIPQGGGGSVAETMCCGVANLGDVRKRGGCYGSVAKAVAVAQRSAIAVAAIAQAGKSTLFLRLFAIGGDRQSKDDGDLGKTTKVTKR